jgi:hypothetical protein
MSNILKTIDLTDHAIRRAVFAVLDGLAAEQPAARRATEQTRALQYLAQPSEAHAATEQVARR